MFPENFFPGKGKMNPEAPVNDMNNFRNSEYLLSTRYFSKGVEVASLSKLLLSKSRFELLDDNLEMTIKYSLTSKIIR